MTNKTTPDDDWLDEILNTLELKIIPEEGYIAPKVHAEAKQAINAKITELLVAENTLACMAWENNPALPATYLIERTKQLQASQPQTNLNESEM
jgi:hypothetical protein